MIAAVAVLGLAACRKDELKVDYKQEMRTFVQSISAYAKNIHPGFIVIPQNGQQLLTSDGTASGSIATDYLNAIDGVGREDLFYGYENDDEATPSGDQQEMLPFMDIAKNNNIKVLAIDYCSTLSNMSNSYDQNNARGYISFAADHRGLDNIPSYPSSPYAVNAADVNTLADAKNFLYLINISDDAFSSKQGFLNAVAATNYDAVIMDINYGDWFFTAAEINSLKHKANGGSRKIICYMSIGEAEAYRYYWQDLWNGVPPQWMVAENAQWGGNYKVKYWDKEWQGIIYGNPNSYTNRIISAGFDGVYLDIIDGFEYFEN